MASRGPPLGAAHPARYPTVSRFLLEDWARRAMRADLPSRTSIEAENFQIRPELKDDVCSQRGAEHRMKRRRPLRVYMYRIAAGLSPIHGIRGPPLGAAHPARYPTLSRFILEDWATPKAFSRVGSQWELRKSYFWPDQLCRDLCRAISNSLRVGDVRVAASSLEARGTRANATFLQGKSGHFA